MPQVFRYELAAQILAEAAVLGDHDTVRRHGISLRTLQRYRQRLAKDPKLAESVARKKAVLEREWATELAPAIRQTILFLRRAAQEADPRDPHAIHAVAGALKILADVAMTQKVLDARLAGIGGAESEAPGALATALA